MVFRLNFLRGEPERGQPPGVRQGEGALSCRVRLCAAQRRGDRARRRARRPACGATSYAIASSTATLQRVPPRSSSWRVRVCSGMSCGRAVGQRGGDGAPVAKVEEILEGGAKQVHHHHIVVALHGEAAHRRDAHAAAEDLVELGLVQQLRVLALNRLELDGDLLAGGDVRAKVDVTERAAPNLAPQPVLVGHPNLHGRHVGGLPARARKAKGSTQVRVQCGVHDGGTAGWADS